MSPRLIRKFCALSSAVVLSVVGLGAPALADPGEDPSRLPAEAAPQEPGSGAESTARRIPVVVMMKDQPGSPSAAEEKGNLSQQDDLLADWTGRYGLEVESQFGYLVNGFSATIPVDRMAALSTEPEVASVKRERVYEQSEHTARVHQGVPAAFAEHGTDGTGTVISIIDSGIDPSHQDMRLDSCEDAKIQEIDPSPEAGFTCKVPTGYNYADDNMVVKDTTSSQHGMHVAGIAAANGSEGDDADDVLETGRVDGAAPNAQLLAMKVFSNSGGGAKDSDIIAAIEDSVKLDSDVINMSLGSANGFQNTSDGTARAVAQAREAGVITVVAAGNDGLNFSPTGVEDDAVGKLDDGTVGAPSTQEHSFSVASIDNSSITNFLAYYDDGAENPFTYSAATGSYDDQSHPVVYAGLGKPEDFPADLEGSWALIQRGELSFADKYTNAIDAGAGGVIIYNHAAGGEEFFGMSGVDGFDIPGIVTTHSQGEALREAIAAGDVTVRISEDVDVQDNPTGLQPSSFTSWGATPSLDFTPEIAGIGGSVYSTYNDDTYGTNSGTSMASPNIAGMAALIVQDQNEEHPDLTGADRVDASRIALMNTAQIPEVDGVPYSPRQVGAGLGRVDHALDTEVSATVDGEPSVALREVTSPRDFTVTLENSSDEVRSFDIPAQQVLIESNVPGEATTVSVGGGSLSASTTSVDVPAGGSASVTFTLTPSGGEDHFVGGWARLESSTAGEPDLSVPYLGFDGDWNAEPILTAPGEEFVPGLPVTTQLIGSAGDVTVPLDSDSGELWLSPNDDGYLDAVSSQLAFQRNASDVRYEILDADGEVVTVLGEEQDMYRRILGDYLASPDPQSETLSGATFDGYTWDPQAADVETVPDGRYVYRVSSRLSADQEWQSTDMPFGVDAAAPEVEVGELEGTTLPVTVTEDGSGLLEAPSATAADGTALTVTALDGGRYTVEVPSPQQVPYVTISAIDRGLNEGTDVAILGGEAVVVPSAEALAAEGTIIGAQTPEVLDGFLEVSGYVREDVAEVTVNGEAAEVEDGTFWSEVELVEGPQEITVVARDDAGEELGSVTYSVTYDGTAPEIALADGTVSSEGTLVPGEDGSITLEGTVSDERQDAALGLTVDGIEVEVSADGTFSTSVTPSADQSAVVLAASDGANTGTQTLPIDGREPAVDPEASPFAVTNVDCSFASRACFISGDNPDVTEDGSTFTLRGEVAPGTEVVLTSARTVDESGDWAGEVDYPATVAEDGTFSVDLPMSTGENHFRLLVRDADGAAVVDLGLSFFSDVVAPTLQVDEPTLYGGTLFTNSEQVTFAGTASDDGWGYGFSLNDSTVTEVFQNSGEGPASNERTFSHDLTVADGDTILVHHEDANGNALIGLIPVVLDTAAPEVSVDGLSPDAQVDRDHEATATASDPNLASMRVSIDGEVVSEESTGLVSEELAVEDALVDVRDLEEEGAEEKSAEAPSELAAEDPAAEDPTDEDPAAADTAEEQPPSVLAVGTRSAADAQTLSAPLDFSELETGAHMVTVESRDLAGNVTATSIPFRVSASVEVSGPEAVDVEVHREELGDQQGLAALVLEQYEVTSDGEPIDGATLSLAPGTVLTEGENEVTILGSGPAGQSATAEATVTVTLAEVTLRDGEVTATSTFRSDDELTATWTETEEGTLLEISNRSEFGSLPSLITVPAEKGTSVVRVLPGGERVAVASTWSDGVLTFEGPSQGTYLLLGPAGGAGGGGEGPGGDPVPHPGGGSGNGPGAGGGSGNGPGAGGWMPRTGVDVAGAVVLALMLLGSGFVLLRWAHRED